MKWQLKSGTSFSHTFYTTNSSQLLNTEVALKSSIYIVTLFVGLTMINTNVTSQSKTKQLESLRFYSVMHTFYLIQVILFMKEYKVIQKTVLLVKRQIQI